MQKVVVKGAVVFQCTVCNRKTRLPVNKKGMETLHNCTITDNCKGKLTRVNLLKDINNTPALTPEVPNLKDWHQQKLLHTHNQIIASNEWIINHNLSSHPAAQVFVNTNINGSIVQQSTNKFDMNVVNSNTIKLRFNTPESGTAQIITLSSENVINPIIESLPQESEKVQISNDTGLLTIATSFTTPVVNIQTVFNILGQEPVIVNYNNIDDVANVASPWAGHKKIFIHGKTYIIRTLDIVHHNTAFPIFLSGQIPPQGGAFYISNVNNQPIALNDIIVLNANPPFNPIDKIYDYYIDLGAETNTSSNIFYSFGKVYATPTTIKKVYPYISVVN